MKEQLEAIRAQALEAIASTGSAAELDALRVKYLGKKGELTALLKQMGKQMGKLSPEERPVMGQLANAVRAELEQSMEQQGKKLDAQALEQRLKDEALDITIPGKDVKLGRRHPMYIALDEIKEIKRKQKLSVIFITHDLGVVANMADRICVMYAGKIVEVGTAREIFYSPAHPYTWALLSSMPDLETKERLFSIPGTPPNMIFPPKGDAFAERNQYAMQVDFEEEPPFFKLSDTHYAATWLLHPNAPKVEMPEALQHRIARMNRKEGV